MEAAEASWDNQGPIMTKLPPELRMLVVKWAGKLDDEETPEEEEERIVGGLDEQGEPLPGVDQDRWRQTVMFAVSLLNREFFEYSSPYMWRKVDFEGRTVPQIRFFLYKIAPRHAKHVKNIWLRISTQEVNDYDDSNPARAAGLSLDDAERVHPELFAEYESQPVTLARNGLFNYKEGFLGTTAPERVLPTAPLRPAQGVQVEEALPDDASPDWEDSDSDNESLDSEEEQDIVEDLLTEGARHNLFLAILGQLGALETLDYDYFPLILQPSRRRPTTRQCGSTTELLSVIEGFGASLVDLSVYADSDEGLEIPTPYLTRLLTAFPKLERLEITGTQGDSPNSGFLEKLSQMPNLSELSLDACQFAADKGFTAADWTAPISALALSECRVPYEDLRVLLGKFKGTLTALLLHDNSEEGEEHEYGKAPYDLPYLATVDFAGYETEDFLALFTQCPIQVARFEDMYELAPTPEPFLSFFAKLGSKLKTVIMNADNELLQIDGHREELELRLKDLGVQLVIEVPEPDSDEDTTDDGYYDSDEDSDEDHDDYYGGSEDDSGWVDEEFDEDDEF